MSYCVSCGVELEESLESCPLCKTVVLNPNNKADKKIIRKAYPSQYQRLNAKINRRFAVSLASVFMFLSGVICLLLNYIYEGQISWSKYVLGGIALAWIIVMSPFVFKKHSLIKATILDSISVIGYLYVIESITDAKGWLIPLALPIIVAASLIIILEGVAISNAIIKSLHIPAAVFVGLGLLLIVIESRLDLYLFGKISFDWSLIALAVLVALSVVFLILERKKKIKNEIKKRLHF